MIHWSGIHAIDDDWVSTTLTSANVKVGGVMWQDDEYFYAHTHNRRRSFASIGEALNWVNKVALRLVTVDGVRVAP